MRWWAFIGLMKYVFKDIENVQTVLSTNPSSVKFAVLFGEFKRDLLLPARATRTFFYLLLQTPEPVGVVTGGCMVANTEGPVFQRRIRGWISYEHRHWKWW